MSERDHTRFAPAYERRGPGPAVHPSTASAVGRHDDDVVTWQAAACQLR
jgi:hypothetical protein